MTLPKLSKPLIMRGVLLIILALLLVSFLFQEESPSPPSAPPPTTPKISILPSPTALPTPSVSITATPTPTAEPPKQEKKEAPNWRSIEETIKQAIIPTPTPTPLPKKIPPPPYHFFGRGLVYSCSRRHWACVDQTSYLQCQAHAKSMAFYKRPALCVTENVYNSQVECEEAQQAKIDRSLGGENCNK